MVAQYNDRFHERVNTNVLGVRFYVVKVLDQVDYILYRRIIISNMLLINGQEGAWGIPNFFKY